MNTLQCSTIHNRRVRLAVATTLLALIDATVTLPMPNPAVLVNAERVAHDALVVVRNQLYPG